MNCEQAREAMIGGVESSDLDAHLNSCSQCRAEEPAVRRIRETLAASAFWEEPSPEMAERIASIGRVVATRPQARTKVLVLIPAVMAVMVLITGFLLTSDRADWEFDLTAVGEGANATAMVSGWNESAGTRLRIEVNGIEPAPAGHYYEIWLTSPQGLHVSAGTFTGDGVITASVGVRRSDFPRLWITSEPFDGDAGPSSDTYFDTTQ